MIPAGAVLAWIPDFVIGSAVLFVVMAVFGFVPPLTAVLLPVVMVATMIAAFSVGVWLSALNVAYRDVQYVVPFLIQAWLFITPVAYPTTSIPESLRWLDRAQPDDVGDRLLALGAARDDRRPGAWSGSRSPPRSSCSSAACTTSDASSTSSPMSSEIAIRAEGIGKRYRIGATQGVGRYRSLREDIAGLASQARPQARAARSETSGR